MKYSKTKGAIYGAIMGDIYGLRYEGVHPKHINSENIFQKTFYKQYSDDTEHLFMMSDAILTSNSREEFNKKFTINLRKWLFTMPYGIGKTTLVSIFKSFFTKQSGIKSQGNGALMRSGLLGLIIEKSQIRKYVESNVKVTHNDPESIETSVLKAKLINYLINNKEIITNEKVFELLESKNQNWNKYLNMIKESISKNEDTLSFSKKLSKRGVPGYTMFTLTISIYSFLKNKHSFEKGLKEVISCGGDTDTNGFVYGMIAGAYHGYQELHLELNDKGLEKTLDKLSMSIYKKEKEFSYSYSNWFISNVFMLPLVFLEVIKRYCFYIIKKKI